MSQRLKDAVNIIVLLFIGAAAGVTLSAWGRYLSHSPGRPPGPPPPGERAERFINEFGSELHLSVAQEDKVREIFEAQHQKLEQIRLETEPKFREITKQTRAQIESILTPEQLKDASKLLKRLDRGPFGGPAGPPPPPPPGGSF